ncbi:MAG: ECF-type sigma factor [Acidobacteriota bacterium]
MPGRPADSPRRVTQLLAAWRGGEPSALAEVIEKVYPQLRRIAASHMRKDKSRGSLQPTALVHELYIQLLDASQIEYRDRSHFFAVASKIMRRVLVDHARRRRARKRDGIHVSLSSINAATELDVNALDLDAALSSLEASFPFEAQVVELRYFGGLTIEEAAEHLDVGHATVQRAWSFAKAWLAREMYGKQS